MGGFRRPIEPIRRFLLPVLSLTGFRRSAIIPPEQPWRGDTRLLAYRGGCTMDGTGKIGSKYNVGGVLLDRPFKIRRLGHFGYNVYKMDEAMHFYNDLLGFRITDTLDFARVRPDGAKLFEGISAVGYFTTHGTDHHSFVLFPKPA